MMRASVALRDCFTATTAAARGLVLLTGDPELLELTDPPRALEDLRAR
jgi:predicted nucleic acid-binding protein